MLSFKRPTGSRYAKILRGLYRLSFVNGTLGALITGMIVMFLMRLSAVFMFPLNLVARVTFMVVGMDMLLHIIGDMLREYKKLHEKSPVSN